MSEPVRLVVIAPLAGTGTTRTAAPLRAGAGQLDRTVADVAPRLDLRLPGTAEPVQLAFASLEDFTPASLARRVPEPALAAVLRHPAYLELEAAWRGLDFLLTRGGEGLLVDVLAISPREDVLPRFREQVFDPEYEGRTEVPLTAVLADVEVGPGADDLDRLARLGELANALQVAWVTAASPAFFGLKRLAHLPALPDLVGHTSGGACAAWNGLQALPWTRWVCLTVNRFLLRPPHTGPAFEEKADPAHPEWLCWGRAPWAVGVSLARSFAEHGHAAASDGLSGTGGHAGLAAREVPGGRSSIEVVLSDEKAWELCRAGFTPLLGMADGDLAYFPFLGNAYRPRRGSITLDQSLVYHLYAGQLGRLALRLVGEVPPGDAGLTAAWLTDRLEQRLPGVGVEVNVEDQVAALRFTPTFRIQDKPLNLEMRLGLGRTGG